MKVTYNTINGVLVTLKKLTYSKALSEETMCFTADVYMNGKLTANISNRGNGAPDNIHFVPNANKSHFCLLNEVLDDIETCDFIFTLVTIEVERKKHQSKALVFIDEATGDIGRFKLEFSVASYKKNSKLHLLHDCMRENNELTFVNSNL